MKKFKTEKGITLIALIITIIVLLILAGVSISMALGENGILTRSENAKERYEYATAKEIIELKVANLDMERIIEGTEVSELQYLANGLHPNADSEMEYVDVATRIASTSNIVIGDSISSIFVKLKAYKYEFEIDRTGKIVGAIDTETKEPVVEDSSEAENITWITEEENGELTIIGAYVKSLETENYHYDDVVFGTETLVFPSSIDGKSVKKVDFQKLVYNENIYTWFDLSNADFDNIIVEEGIEEFKFDSSISVDTISFPNTLKNSSYYIDCNILSFPNGKNAELSIANIEVYETLLIENTEVPFIKSVSLGEDDRKTLKVGETLDLSQYLQTTPDNITIKSINWESYDTSYATVDENGLVTATAPHEYYLATIRVSVSDEYFTKHANYYIKVEE